MTDEKKISELLEPFVGGTGLSEPQIAQVSAYLGLLLKWNAKTNLTSVRSPEEIVTRHFGESFFAARRIKAEGSFATAIDLGSGAGFPGMPIAIFSPEMQVTLIESQNKKATFLKEVARALDLKNAKVFNGRGEDFNDRAELVTLRAVEKFDQAAPTAAGLVAPNGRLALLIGEGQVVLAPELLPAFEWQAPIAVPKSSARLLLVGRRR